MLTTILISSLLLVFADDSNSHSRNLLIPKRVGYEKRFGCSASVKIKETARKCRLDFLGSKIEFDYSTDLECASSCLIERREADKNRAEAKKFTITGLYTAQGGFTEKLSDVKKIYGDIDSENCAIYSAIYTNGNGEKISKCVRFTNSNSTLVLQKENSDCENTCGNTHDMIILEESRTVN